ncbi:hypothetical protein [Streptomyces sp. NPDC059224]|uniref:hypothetical protein n=1 Tax=Streptomyces sp. NPDC059224 TaxID=3346775 RepID=UPI0036B08C94
MTEIAKRGAEVEPAEPPTLLTAEDIARLLAEIHAVRDDPEAAHGRTDDLHRAVLATIAAGAPDAELLAAAALRTETLDFARWCA